MQVDDLAQTIEAVPADAAVVATPIDLNRLIHMTKPSTTVAWALLRLLKHMQLPMSVITDGALSLHLDASSLIWARRHLAMQPR